METLKGVLSALQSVFWLWFSVEVFNIVLFVAYSALKVPRPPLAAGSILARNIGSWKMWLIVSTLLVNQVAYMSSDKSAVGGLYEATVYDNSMYGAMIFPKGSRHMLPCILNISRDSDFDQYEGYGYDNYYINEISFEGKTIYDGNSNFELYIDDKYDEHKFGKLYVGYDRKEFEVVFAKKFDLNPVTLPTITSVDVGSGFCMSMDSKVFHLSDCHYAKRIKPANKFEFADIEWASLFWAEMCSSCSERY